MYIQDNLITTSNKTESKIKITEFKYNDYFNGLVLIIHLTFKLNTNPVLKRLTEKYTGSS